MNESITCPHCKHAAYVDWENAALAPLRPEAKACLAVRHARCPRCEQVIAQTGIVATEQVTTTKAGSLLVRQFTGSLQGARFFFPIAAQRPVPEEVPQDLAGDFREACNVLLQSANASAALSRRCLQHLLREHFRVKPSALFDGIGEVLAAGTLSEPLKESIDAVRNVGNIAAHPMKSLHTGEIVEVEAGEAEWLLDTLEELFQFKFVQPARIAAKKAALNTS